MTFGKIIPVTYSCPVCQSGTMVLVARKRLTVERLWICDNCESAWDEATVRGDSLEISVPQISERVSWEDVVVISEDYDAGERDSLAGRVSDTDPDAGIKRRANEGRL